MIGTLLLSLPLICLTSGILYFSYHLYKLNQVKIPKPTSEILTYEFSDYSEKDIKLLIDLLSSTSTDFKFQKTIQKTNEYSDSIANTILKISLLNDRHESTELDNHDSTISKSLCLLMKHLALAQSFQQNEQSINSWNRENSICHLQNAG